MLREISRINHNIKVRVTQLTPLYYQTKDFSKTKKNNLSSLQRIQFTSKHKYPAAMIGSV